MGSRSAKKGKSQTKLDRKSMKLVFLHEFLISRNATEAALKAGCKPESAPSQATRWLKRADIQEEIRKADQKFADSKLELRERIIQELHRLAFFDPRKLYEPDGSVKLVDKWDDETAAAIAYMDVAEIFAGQGEQKMAIGLSKKVALHPKPKALELLMKHLGMFAPEKVAQTDTAGNDLPRQPVNLSNLSLDELRTLQAIQAKLKCPDDPAKA